MFSEQNSLAQFKDLPSSSRESTRHFANTKLTIPNQDTFDTLYKSPKIGKIVPFVTKMGKRDSKGKIQNIGKIMKLKGMAKKLIQSVDSYHFKILKNVHYQLINDKAVSYKAEEDENSQADSNCLSSLTQKYYQSKYHQSFKTFFDKIPVFQPSHSLKLMWDLLEILATLLLFFYIPINMATDIEYDNLMTRELYLICIIIEIILIPVSLNTGFYEQGIIQKNRYKIVQNYVNSQLIPDTLALFGLLADIIDRDQDINIDWMFFVKIKYFQRQLKRLEDSFHLKPKTGNLIQLLKLLGSIIFISHIFASIWLYIGQYNTSLGVKSWMNQKNLLVPLSQESWQIQYLHAYYFSTLTMVTVGYGDYVPMNGTEVAISIMTMMLSCGVFAYSINAIGTIFQDYFQEDRIIQNNLYVINNYMENKRVSYQLRCQIREYLDYFWRESSEQNSEQESKIIDQLSDELKNALMIESNKIVLTDSPIFRNNFSPIIVQKTVKLIREQLCHPEQIICKQGQCDDNSIFFIEKGTLEIYMDQNFPHGDKGHQTLKLLGPNDCFGDLSFFTALPRYANIRSLSFSKLLVIKREDFVELIKNYPEEYEKFCLIKDKIMFENDYSTVIDCHLLHYRPSLLKVTKIENSKIQEKRDQLYKRKLNRFQLWKNISNVMKKACSFFEQNESFIEVQSWIEDSEFPNSDETQSIYEQSETPDENSSSDKEDAQQHIVNITNGKTQITQNCQLRKCSPTGSPTIEKVPFFGQQANQNKIEEQKINKKKLKFQRLQTYDANRQIIESKEEDDTHRNCQLKQHQQLENPGEGKIIETNFFIFDNSPISNNGDKQGDQQSQADIQVPSNLNFGLVCNNLSSQEENQNINQEDNFDQLIKSKIQQQKQQFSQGIQKKKNTLQLQHESIDPVKNPNKNEKTLADDEQKSTPHSHNSKQIKRENSVSSNKNKTPFQSKMKAHPADYKYSLQINNIAGLQKKKFSNKRWSILDSEDHLNNLQIPATNNINETQLQRQQGKNQSIINPQLAMSIQLKQLQILNQQLTQQIQSSASTPNKASLSSNFLFQPQNTLHQLPQLSNIDEEQNDFSIIMNFDHLKKFDIYYVQHNYDIILTKYNAIINSNLHKIIKKPNKNIRKLGSIFNQFESFKKNKQNEDDKKPGKINSDLRQDLLDKQLAHTQIKEELSPQLEEQEIQNSNIKPTVNKSLFYSNNK